MRPFRPHLAGIAKKLSANGSPQLKAPKLKGSRVAELLQCDIYMYDIIPSAASTGQKPKPTHHIYYFSGGGFQTAPSTSHWALCGEIATQLSATHDFTLVSYPLAPKCPAPKAMPMLYRLMQSIVADAQESGQHVVLMGDSSGGNVALCLALWWASTSSGKEVSAAGGEATVQQVGTQPLKEEASILRRPQVSVFAMCPVVDMTNRNAEIDEVDKVEVLLTAKMTDDVARIWSGDWDRADPRISPLLADLTPLRDYGVVVNGMLATYDVLSPDGIKFRKELARLRVKGEWLEWKGQMHCFPLAFKYPIREAREGKDWMVEVLKRQNVMGEKVEA
jgi:acetyl esterase/lipase